MTKFAPKITLDVDTAILATVKVELPEFKVEIEEAAYGDFFNEDGNIEDGYVGVFSTPVYTHTVNLYGPTPEHVAGLANLYARKLTGGLPYILHYAVDVDIPQPQLP